MANVSRSIRNWPESERPRERLLTLGPDRLTTTELVAILLGSGLKGKSAVEVARECLRVPLPEINQVRLAQIKGLGPGKTARVLAGLELGKRLLDAQGPQDLRLKCSAEVFAYLQPRFLGKTEELFAVLILDTKNRPQKWIEVARGQGEAVHFRPAEMFQKVLLEGASAFICLHNHPSGDPEPSPEDRELTRRLREGAQVLGLRLLDHLVLGHRTYYSFADQGWS